MEETQEAGPEAESQRLRCLRLKGERGVVELELIQRLAQVAVVISLHGVDSGEYHGFRGTISGQWFGSGRRGARDRIPHPALVDRFEAGRDVAHFAGSETLNGLHPRSKYANLHRSHIHFGGEHAQDIGGFERAFDNPDVGDHALIGIIVRIEDQGAQWDIVRILRRRDTCHDRFQDLVDVDAFLGRDLDYIQRVDP